MQSHTFCGARWRINRGAVCGTKTRLRWQDGHQSSIGWTEVAIFDCDFVNIDQPSNWTSKLVWLVLRPIQGEMQETQDAMARTCDLQMHERVCDMRIRDRDLHFTKRGIISSCCKESIPGFAVSSLTMFRENHRCSP